MENESSPDDKEVDPIDSNVIKIEMDKKEKEDEENGEKILPHGNISFAGRSRLLPTSIPKTVNDERNIHIVKSSSDNPLTLKMPADFKKCQEENIIHTSNSISGSQTGTKSDFKTFPES
jgi:hypothetical protein